MRYSAGVERSLMDGVQMENGWFAFTSIYHANISSWRVIETRRACIIIVTAQYIRFSSSVSCSIFFMFMYSNPIVVHRIFYLCKILQDLLPKPLLLTILLTSQAIELESTSKNVSFNASTYIVPFRLHGGIPLSSSLVSNSIFEDEWLQWKMKYAFSFG